MNHHDKPRFLQGGGCRRRDFKAIRNSIHRRSTGQGSTFASPVLGICPHAAQPGTAALQWRQAHHHHHHHSKYTMLLLYIYILYPPPSHNHPKKQKRCERQHLCDLQICWKTWPFTVKRNRSLPHCNSVRSEILHVWSPSGCTCSIERTSEYLALLEFSPMTLCEGDMGDSSRILLMNKPMEYVKSACTHTATFLWVGVTWCSIKISIRVDTGACDNLQSTNHPMPMATSRFLSLQHSRGYRSATFPCWVHPTNGPPSLAALNGWKSNWKSTWTWIKQSTTSN